MRSGVVGKTHSKPMYLTLWWVWTWSHVVGSWVTRTMNGEDWPNWVWEITGWKHKNYRPFSRNLSWNIPRINKEKLKDQTVYPIGLGNARNLTKLSPKNLPRQLDNNESHTVLEYVSYDIYKDAEVRVSHPLKLTNNTSARCTRRLDTNN